jgi:heme-degrading monooxygenase HmoA
MYARIARYEVQPARMEDAIEHFRDAAPKIEGLDGLERGYVLVDDGGTLVTMTLWASRTALEASETRAASVRQAAAHAADGTVQSVASYEVAVELERRA